MTSWPHARFGYGVTVTPHGMNRPTMPNTPIEITQCSQEFIRAELTHGLEDTMGNQEKIISKFLISSWPGMPRTQYTLGFLKSGNRIWWWLGFESTILGSIGGSTASKRICFIDRAFEPINL